ncbi:hypothetical protein CK203_100285 [Vitis vinifera]|uniref:Uncharacterized protein n=1 Tax=Vitis vinifera TaxID=29760 RepID=A0A438EJE3_VITVI|nr:hypothetical protein CK203_100285 [Vitis vinifera]
MEMHLFISCELLGSDLKVINFVDYSLNQRAPADMNQLRHQLGTNQMARCREGANFIVILFQLCMPKWIRDSGGRLVKLETPHNKELEVILNIMETTPEDQHSHHDHQDNPNEFRSMRDRMHPPRMSAPSCIVPPTEQLVIRPHIVPLLPNGNYFYDGMSSSMKQLLETMCGGDFMSKNPEEAMDFLSYVAEVSRGWDEPHRGEVGKMKSQPNALHAKAGMYTLNEDVDMKAKFAAMTRRVEELELKKCMKCKLLLKHQCNPIAMLRMAILTTQVGGIIQIFHGSQEHLSTNSRLNHLNHPNKLQVLNKQ